LFAFIWLTLGFKPVLRMFKSVFSDQHVADISGYLHPYANYFKKCQFKYSDSAVLFGQTMSSFKLQRIPNDSSRTYLSALTD
jgi:hypothetical protein